MNTELTQIEKEIIRNFACLYDPNDSLPILSDGEGRSWARCALTDAGKILLIETNSQNSPFTRSLGDEKRIYRGRIQVFESILEIENEERAFIAIQCREESLSQLFYRLIADILASLVSDGPQQGDPWHFIVDRLDGWKALFAPDKSKSEEKGLIGELFCLHTLIRNRGIGVKSWTGPLGGTKDFRLTEENIEVKTTATRSGYLVKFHGIFQTQRHAERERILFVRLEQTPNGSVTIQKLSDRIISLLKPNDEYEFIRRLNSYPTEVIESENRWEILETVLFEMGDDFPRITENSFVGGHLPARIFRIDWVADLAGLPKEPFLDSEQRSVE